MKSSFGQTLRVTVWGESHAPSVGVDIDGFPAGYHIDPDAVAEFMSRRAPGRDEFSTSRREDDIPEFLSGVENGVTTGGVIRAEIKNRDVRSSDYDNVRNVPRPGHADYAARVKYGDGYNMAGGGPFSGRMTAPLCAAGALAIGLLSKNGITVHAEPVEIGGVSGCIDAMKKAIEGAKADGDSVGGVVECVAGGLPAGVGGPLFDGMEGLISSAVFAIPAVKGIEFGAGFSAARMRGSENNDPFAVKDGIVTTTKNDHGGILGGITSGAPLVFRAAFKPTPSIAKEQDSVDLTTLENVKLTVKGRHDPCVVLRAVPAVESACAIAILDALLTDGRILKTE
ncbi:MAG: chorismate synthase [Clostridia bacterium]|nr:chorismate synthase [Clostridia bacterium]